jgi:hypothetical protein
VSTSRCRSISAGVAFVAFILAAGTPASAQQASAWSNPLDAPSDVAAWYIDGYPFVWAVDDTPVGGHDSAASLNFNDGADYNGDWCYGAAESNAIDLTGMTTPTLTFWCRFETLSTAYGYPEYRELYLHDPNWDYYYYYTIGDANADLDCGAMNEWHQHTITLEPDLIAAGSMMVYFYFYSETQNQAAGLDGWFVDDLRILVPDVTAPAAIANLSAGSPTLDSLTVTWSSPTDDDISGVCESFDLRYSLNPIATDADFDAATPVTGVPAPGVAGTSHSVVVGSLLEDTQYYFVIKTTDKAGNVSGLSNVPSATTLAPPPPPPPPPPLGPPKPKDDYPFCGAGAGGSPQGMIALAILLAVAFTAGLLRR